MNLVVYKLSMVSCSFKRLPVSENRVLPKCITQFINIETLQHLPHLIVQRLVSHPPPFISRDWGCGGNQPNDSAGRKQNKMVFITKMHVYLPED